MNELRNLLENSLGEKGLSAKLQKISPTSKTGMSQDRIRSMVRQAIQEELLDNEQDGDYVNGGRLGGSAVAGVLPMTKQARNRLYRILEGNEAAPGPGRTSVLRARPKNPDYKPNLSGTQAYADANFLLSRYLEHMNIKSPFDMKTRVQIVKRIRDSGVNWDKLTESQYAGLVEHIIAEVVGARSYPVRASRGRPRKPGVRRRRPGRAMTLTRNPKLPRPDPRKIKALMRAAGLTGGGFESESDSDDYDSEEYSDDDEYDDYSD